MNQKAGTPASGNRPPNAGQRRNNPNQRGSPQQRRSTQQSQQGRIPPQHKRNTQQSQQNRSAPQQKRTAQQQNRGNPQQKQNTQNQSRGNPQQKRTAQQNRGNPQQRRNTQNQNRGNTQQRRNTQQQKPQQKRSVPQKKLTPEQIAQREKQRRLLQQKKKQRRVRALQILGARVTLFFIMFGILLVVTLSCFFLNLFTGNSPSRRSYTFSVVQSLANEKTPKTETDLPYDRAYIDGTVYVNFSYVAGLYGFITTGDVDEIAFLSDVDATEIVRFTIGTGYCTVNDVPCRITSPFYTLGNDVYVPMEFISRYVRGVTVECNQKKRLLTLTRQNDTMIDSFVPITFTLHQDSDSLHVDELLLDEDIRLMTDPNVYNYYETGN